MSVTPIAAAVPEPDGDNYPTEPPRPQGIYAIPILGPRFQQARDVTEGLRPTENDSVPQVVAKRTAQASVIAGTAAITAIIVL